MTAKEEAIAVIYAGKISPGDVVVIRYEGPKGGPGMREMLNPTSAICGMGLGESVALITDVTSLAPPGAPPSVTSPGGRFRRYDRLGGGGRQISINIPGHKISWGPEDVLAAQGRLGLPGTQSQDRLSGPLCQPGHQCRQGAVRKQ